MSLRQRARWALKTARARASVTWAWWTRARISTRELERVLARSPDETEADFDDRARRWLADIQTQRAKAWRWQQEVCRRLGLDPAITTPERVEKLLHGVFHLPWRVNMCEALALPPDADGEAIVQKSIEMRAGAMKDIAKELATSATTWRERCEALERQAEDLRRRL